MRGKGDGFSAVVDALKSVGFTVPDEVENYDHLVIAIKSQDAPGASGGGGNGGSDDMDDLTQTEAQQRRQPPLSLSSARFPNGRRRPR
jgi:hypothetical protein